MIQLASRVKIHNDCPLFSPIKAKASVKKIKYIYKKVQTKAHSVVD